jgi:hypothetical protein
MMRIDEFRLTSATTVTHPGNLVGARQRDQALRCDWFGLELRVAGEPVHVAVRKADNLRCLNDEPRLRSHPDRAGSLDDEMVRNDPTCTRRETFGEVGDRRAADAASSPAR